MLAAFRTFPPFLTRSSLSLSPFQGCSPPATALPLKATVRSLAPQTDGRTNVTLSLAVDATLPAGVAFVLAAKARAAGGEAVDLACAAAGAVAAVCSGAFTLADPFDCLTTALAVEAAVETVDKAGKRCPAGTATAAVDACQQCVEMERGREQRERFFLSIPLSFSQPLSLSPFSHHNRPQCQLFAVDMGYCGSEGLVTDRESATLVLACTDAVSACGNCFSVSGPPGGGHVAAFATAPGSNSSYTLTVTWDDKAYRGPVTVAVEPVR